MEKTLHVLFSVPLLNISPGLQKMKIFAICSLFVFSLSATCAIGAIKRDDANGIDKIVGGVLVKNGMQTSCELLVIDSHSAVVSADCLDIENGVATSRSFYEVYTNDGTSGKQSKYQVEQIDINSGYNAKTKADNFAVLQYNSASNMSFQNLLGIIPDYYGGEIVYARHVLNDANTMEWGNTLTTVDTAKEDTKCDAMSEIYKYNHGNFKCFYNLVKSPSDNLTQCSIPYGVVYARALGTTYLLGLHSHTSALRNSDNACNYQEHRSYFLLIPDYIYTIQNIIGRSVKYTPVKNSNAPLQDSSYHMDTSDVTGNNDGYDIIGGDFYKIQGSKVTLSSDAPIELSSQTSLSTDYSSDSHSMSTDSNADDISNHENSRDTVMRRNYIIIGICSGVGLLIICAIVFILIRKWRAKRAVGMDPIINSGFEVALANELGGATVPGAISESTDHSEIDNNHDPPPQYEQSASTIVTIKETKAK